MIDNYILRIAAINLNNNILILKEMNNLSSNELYDKTKINAENNFLKLTFLELGEELESAKFITRYNALSKIFSLFIKDPDFNFMLSDRLDEIFEQQIIALAFSQGLLVDLIKNLSYLFYKFNEYNK